MTQIFNQKVKLKTKITPTKKIKKIYKDQIKNNNTS